MIELIPSVFVYAGGIIVLAGFVCLVKPITRLGLRTRPRAAGAALFGVALATGGFLWPSRESASTIQRTHLDRAVPRWQFGERHTLRVHAAPDVVYRAMRDVTADEIALYRALTWIRSPRVGRAARENILAPGSGPLLETALTSGFLLLIDDPPREIVFGTLLGAVPHFTRRPTPEEYLALQTPGITRAVMNFRIDPEPDGWSRVETETRVAAVDDSTRRMFGVYWRVIYPGSALIRMAWLRAINTRAESARAAGGPG